MMELVLATENLHKIREFRDMFKGVKGIDLLSLSQFPDYTPPEETGVTFAENAELKALHAAKFLNRIVLADDSGLVVPGLRGEPGVYSRRYAGGNATDSENRRKLLSETKHLEGESRAAYFECALAIAGPEGIKKSISAKVEGLLLTEEKGKHGFGYDPIFQKYDSHLSFAELDEVTKNRISHRHKALQKILPTLEALAR